MIYSGKPKCFGGKTSMLCIKNSGGYCEFELECKYGIKSTFNEEDMVSICDDSDTKEIDSMEWITLKEVLDLPYGTKLERYESDYIYIIEQELKIIDLSRESERNYPSIDKDLLNAKFKVINF